VISSERRGDVQVEVKRESFNEAVSESYDIVVEAEERNAVRGQGHRGDKRSDNDVEKRKFRKIGGFGNPKRSDELRGIDSSGASDGEDEDEDGGDVEGQGEVGVSDESSVGIETRGRVGGSGHKIRRGRVGGSGHKSRRGRVGGCGHKCRRGRVGGSGHKSKREFIDRVLSYFFN
jgi:hypothetical protein